MKKFILDKINCYIPYLENNYPIFLENSERLIEFNLNFEDGVTKFMEHCDMLFSKKKDQIDSSLNDRYTESKLLESNNNGGLTNNNILISNNLQSNLTHSNTNSQNVNNNNNSQNVNNNNNSQNINNLTEKPNTHNVISEEHDSSNQNVAKTGTLNSLNKEEQAINGLSKNEESSDINGIPIRRDFSEDSSNSFFTTDKIFLETIYSKKTKNELTNQDFNIMDTMMLNDSDLEAFLYALEKHDYFEGKLLIVEQCLTDETSIKISCILKKNKPKITVLDLSKNYKMNKLTGVYIGESLRFNTTLKSLFFNSVNLTTEGANRLIESILYNKNLRDIDFGNLTDSSLLVLANYLKKEHHLANISFGEDISEPWREDSKNELTLALRKNQFNKQLLSINIYCEDVWTHYNLLGNVSLFTQKNREIYLKEENNIYKLRALEYKHPEYFEKDNHVENKYKFSCKNYISNVFSTVLDEGLYYLEKERMNMLRDAEIANVKNEKDNQDKFLEDICTANGSILFLCQFLLTKLDKQN